MLTSGVPGSVRQSPTSVPIVAPPNLLTIHRSSNPSACLSLLKTMRGLSVIACGRCRVSRCRISDARWSNSDEGSGDSCNGPGRIVISRLDCS
jgi:hypothetical protein